jgi:ribose transport system substrate-binding protein
MSVLKWRPARLVAGIGAVLLMMTACGSEDSDASSNSGASSADLQAAESAVKAGMAKPTKITETEPLGQPIPEGKKIFFLVNAVASTTVIADAAEEAVDALGWSFTRLTYDLPNPATLQSALSTALSQDADAVLLTGVTPAVISKSVLDDYDSAEVPLIFAGSCPVTVEGAVAVAVGGCDEAEAVGKLVADWFISDSKGQGKVLWAHVTAFPVYVTYGDAFAAEVEAKCPDCEVETIELTAEQVSGGQVVPTAVNGLRSNPDMKYLLFDNGDFTTGIDSALAAAGLKDVRVFGRSINPERIAALQGGDEGAWSATSYPLYGYSLVDVAVRKLMGLEPSPAGLISPFQLLSSENSEGVAAPFNEPADALEQYKALWGVE